MKISSAILDAIRNSCEAVSFGDVLIHINEAGKYVEIVESHRKRFTKEGDLDKIEGRTTVYRTDA
jgi:hypothetical protein